MKRIATSLKLLSPCILLALLINYGVSLARKHRVEEINVTEPYPGWIKLMARPQDYNGKLIYIRGVLTQNYGAGTGIEIWMADWAMLHGQTEFYIHMENESAIAFFEHNHSTKAKELEGKTVEVHGTFVANSLESDSPAIGAVKKIMICELDAPAKGGPFLMRPE